MEQDKITMNDVFAFMVTYDITKSDDEVERQSIEECHHKKDWPILEEAIQTELNSLAKYEVFGSLVHTPKRFIRIRYKWVLY